MDPFKMRQATFGRNDGPLAPDPMPAPVLALWQPDRAHNFGAALRLCACFDVELDVIEPTGFPFDMRRIREAALEGVRDELPHSIAVVVEEMLPREDRPADKPLLDIHAFVYIERPSQKGIIIGPKGKRLKEVGIKSRKQIEALLGTPVFLDLHVKVAKDWQRDPRQLRKLGF